MGGLAIRLMAQANELKTPANDPKDYGGSVTWTSGPLYLMYAYEQHKDQVGAGKIGIDHRAGRRVNDVEIAGQ